jgi:hypothetical protein
LALQVQEEMDASLSAAFPTVDELPGLEVQQELEALWYAAYPTDEELLVVKAMPPAALPLAGRAAAERLPPGLVLLEEPSIIELPMDLTSRALGRFFAQLAA